MIRILLYNDKNKILVSKGSGFDKKDILYSTETEPKTVTIPKKYKPTFMEYLKGIDVSITVAYPIKPIKKEISERSNIVHTFSLRDEK